MPVVSRTAAGAVTESLGGLNIGTPVALAAAGSAIGNAAAITGRFTIVSAADNAKGVQLPSTSQVGDVYWIYSSVSANGLLVYPHTNGTINDGSANGSFAMEGRTMHAFVNQNGTNWVNWGLANA